jgi:hypothetical protein
MPGITIHNRPTQFYDIMEPEAVGYRHASFTMAKAWAMFWVWQGMRSYASQFYIIKNYVLPQVYTAARRLSIATGSRLDPSRSKNFSLLHSIQTTSKAHPTSYPVGSVGSFPRGKASWVWSWPFTHSPHGAEAEIDVAISPHAHVSSWCGA